MAVYVNPTISGVKVGETKRRIVETSIKLFSERSYATVTTRDIANAVGVKPASLYSHFPSKEGILRMIYTLFEENLERSRPKTSELVKHAETAPVREVMLRANFHYDPKIQETMDRIVTIAAMECRLDCISEEFLKRNIIDSVWENARVLVERLIELGRVEPFDVQAFLILHTNFAYSAALRNYTRYMVTMEDWYRGVNMLYGMLKPTGL
jgi:AcrR family transcriptional regulator